MSSWSADQLDEIALHAFAFSTTTPSLLSLSSACAALNALVNPSAALPRFVSIFPALVTNEVGSVVERAAASLFAPRTRRRWIGIPARILLWIFAPFATSGAPALLDGLDDGLRRRDVGGEEAGELGTNRGEIGAGGRVEHASLALVDSDVIVFCHVVNRGAELRCPGRWRRGRGGCADASSRRRGRRPQPGSLTYDEGSQNLPFAVSVH